MNGFAPGVENMMYPAERDYEIADGPEAVRHVVREQVKYGVDVIKILATGGVLSQGDKPGAEQMTYEEMKMAVDTAHARDARWPRTRMARRASRMRCAPAWTRSSTAA